VRIADCLIDDEQQTLSSTPSLMLLIKINHPDTVCENPSMWRAVMNRGARKAIIIFLIVVAILIVMAFVGAYV
jgi:hypothetical protein